MKRRTGIFLAGLACAVAGAGLLHNRRPDRRERLHVTIFNEPGYMGRNQTLTWTGGEREVVPLTRVSLPRIGSIRLERLVYRFQPEVRLPNMYILWHALTERPDRSDPEEGVASFIAMHQLAGMFSVGLWEPVRESEARSSATLGRASRPSAARARRGGPFREAGFRQGGGFQRGGRSRHPALARRPGQYARPRLLEHPHPLPRTRLPRRERPPQLNDRLP